MRLLHAKGGLHGVNNAPGLVEELKSCVDVLERLPVLLAVVDQELQGASEEAHRASTSIHISMCDKPPSHVKIARNDWDKLISTCTYVHAFTSTLKSP